MEKDMSLFETFYKKCIIMDKTKQPDGEGGVINTWTDGAAFDAAFPELSPAAQIAAQQSAVQYSGTIVTPTNVALDEGDIFRHEESGSYYRVVGLLPKTPDTASFQFLRYNVRKLQALP